MGGSGRELLTEIAGRDGVDWGFDPETVPLDDAEVLELLEPAVREWWVEQFGEHVAQNDGFFTPPQKEAIPHIHEGRNVLVASPTGSGKCVKPDTPVLVTDQNGARVTRAGDTVETAGDVIARVDGGQVRETDVGVYALDEDAGRVDTAASRVYHEQYAGPLHRIETRAGREVEVTPAHPLLVETATGTEWRRASAIDPGDRIGVPNRIDLPEREVRLDPAGAIETLRDRYERVVTHEDAEAVIAAVTAATAWEDLPPETRRKGLALAGLSVDGLADALDVSVSTVREQVAGDTRERTDETLALVENRLEPLGERELLVESASGHLSRVRYPLTVDEPLARLAAYALATGAVADPHGDDAIPVSRSTLPDHLGDALVSLEREVGVSFDPGHEPDRPDRAAPSAVFLFDLLRVDRARSRDGGFPQWVLNAPASVKRAFLSTFLTLEGEVQGGELRIARESETAIEQLNYLLLSFGILASRGSGKGRPGDADPPTDRGTYRLTVARTPDFERACALFDLARDDAPPARALADGGPAGTRAGTDRIDPESIRQLAAYYPDETAFEAALGDVHEAARRDGPVPEPALRTLSAELEALPDDRPVAALRGCVDRRLERDVAWLEVTTNRTVEYEGRIVDLHVPGPHNFVGGRGGMFLHNTLASFTEIINELYRRERAQEDGLDNSVYCLYVSPLKSLANDIHRNLAVPLDGIAEKLAARGQETDIRHAIRHGDTDDSVRQRMLEETPHILNTTPETLAILLNSPKFKEKLRTVEYVIVDEIHSLAENKRGTHLAVSLERLETMADSSPTRIGCSATIEPLTTVGEFLVGRESPGGPSRDYDLVDTRFVREFDLQLECPTDDLIETPQEVVNGRFYDRLHELVQRHENTLVFTNTRSGAERVLHNLREAYDAYDESNSGCHHGSLSKDRREAIESKLKSGDVDVVTTSTSLELGIDMPYLDLVVQVGSPKSVAALLQRVGRAGHQLGETVEGRVIALDRDELVECAVMLTKAEEGFVDRVFIPENAQDVAAQQVYGMAINDVRPEQEVLDTLRRAYPYRNYTDADWEQLLRYLTADYPGLEEKNVYAKVWRDTNDPPDGQHHYEEYPVGEPLLGKRGRMARVIYMTNIGTIPDSFTCDVFVRGTDEWVGQLDEEYLDTLESGDVFVLGGARYEFRYRRGSKVYVDPTSARPTVPSWFSERLPLSYDLGREILAFQRRVLDRLARGGRPGVREWLRGFPLDENSVRALARLFDQQVAYAGPDSVSTDERLVIEEELDREAYRRHFYVHSTYGREFNDGLSRLLAYHCARRANTDVQVAVADNGFTVSMPLNRKVDVPGVLRELDPGDVAADLRAALDGTDLLKRYFRINATRSLMILKRYKGYEKSAAQQQVSSEMLLSFAEDLESFAVLEETYREILEDKLNIAGIREVIAGIAEGRIEVVGHEVETPSPRAFGLATLMASDVVLAEDESAVLQEFHARVLDQLDESNRDPSGAYLEE